MKLDKKDADVVSKAILFWEQNEQISPELAQNLRSSYEVRNSNVDTIALYALISAVSCGLLAFGALVLDEKWIELLRKKWGFSETIVGIGFTLLAALFIFLAKRRKLKFSEASTSNEAYTITIVLSVAIAIAYWTRSFGYFEGNYARPLWIAATVYGFSARFLNSQLLWTVMLLSLSGAWGAQIHYWSGGSYRLAGMNYPLIMTIWGALIWASSWITGKIGTLKSFERISYVMGVFLFLLAAWTLSIFGNYSDLEMWNMIKQGTLWPWAVGFTILLAALTAYAFQVGNDTLRDICLLFFLLNIYTRYFEYFWDRTSKGIFFAILAVSFWWAGKKAEQLMSGKPKASSDIKN